MTSPVEVIFLGTGTSSSVPHIDCITAHAIPGSSDRPPCRTCLSTLDGSAEGKKNIRRNTSVVVRAPGKQGTVTVLIDCGKDFQAAALEWFPQFGLRQIDAVLLTHAHSDAINGLDDLRAWTLGSRIQPHIDIYVSEETYRNIKRTFPYLVSKEFASGGGDIPEFVWHVCIDNAKPFEINDTSIMVTPFLVHHGRLFSQPAPAAPGLEVDKTPKKEIVQPYMCFAFRIQEDLVYISDCGAIPDEAWSALFPASGRQLPVCILDCLELRTHPSHFGLEQSIEAARKIDAKRTYFLGFSHKLAHDEYVRIGEVIGGADLPTDLTENEANGMELIGKGNPIWVRPAHDGLRIEISPDQRVTDRTYG
ncbi:Lactamase-B domain-containing protein [Mycena sanguinolenta]|uniref:Lactamase-B domain-containing protein n=1 Tax=Mycena sanguinolenta TaxID=230812 RepID=A0A8H6YYV2_9AGAR|nr:Lactamase-B domain-containing protein [Mycena sanguinolenta]